MTGPRAYLQFLSPPTLSWPLQVGQKAAQLVWSGLQGGRYLGGSCASCTTTLTVDRYEEVRVPAGTFKAFRISGAIEGYYAPLGGHVFRTWYAPDARQLVKAESLTSTPLNFQVVALEPSDRVGRAPLQVTLEEPADQARLTTDRLHVVGKVTGGQGITQVTVTLNAVEVARFDERDQPKPIVRLNLPVTLREGQNVLLVTATDAAGETQQAARTVFYEPAPKQAAAGHPLGRAARRPGRQAQWPTPRWWRGAPATIRADRPAGRLPAHPQHPA